MQRASSTTVSSCLLARVYHFVTGSFLVLADMKSSLRFMVCTAVMFWIGLLMIVYFQGDVFTFLIILADVLFLGKGGRTVYLGM